MAAQGRGLYRLLKERLLHGEIDSTEFTERKKLLLTESTTRPRFVAIGKPAALREAWKLGVSLRLGLWRNS